MASNPPQDLYLNISILIGLIIFFSFFIILKFKERKFLRYLILTSGFALLAQIINFINIITIQHDFLLYLAFFLLLCVFYFYYLHYEAISSVKPPFWRYSTIYGFFILCSTFVLITFLNLYKNLNSTFHIISFFTTIFSFLCVSFSLKVVISIYRLTKAKATLVEIIVNLMLLTMNILVIMEYILVLLDIIDLATTYPTIIFLSFLLIIVSSLILLTNYMINKDYIYHLPFPIHLIMVINKSGILAYVRRVSTIFHKETNTGKEEIVSGFINALSILITETLGTESRLKYIDIGKYQIYFSEIFENHGMIAILASGGSYFLQKSLDRFANLISKELLEKIQQPSVRSKEVRERFDKLISQAFPYIVIRKEKHQIEL